MCGGERGVPCGRCVSVAATASADARVGACCGGSLINAMLKRRRCAAPGACARRRQGGVPGRDQPARLLLSFVEARQPSAAIECPGV